MKANLQRANLWEADLDGANLGEAQMQKANLSCANLKLAQLQDAILNNANLQQAKMQGADLRGANLQGAYASYVYLQRADLKGANLQGANLNHARLEVADVKKAQLQATNLWKAHLQGADLNQANLQGAGTVKWKPSSSFRERIQTQIGTDHDLSDVHFEGKLVHRDLESAVEGLFTQDEINETKARLKTHLNKPRSHELPTESGAITGAYTEAEAKTWIADYKRAMSELPDADGLGKYSDTN